MRLSEQEKQGLIQSGYRKTELRQIELASSRTRYECGNIEITADEALDILGREKFINGLSRSAFHWSAVQSSEDGRNVYFDSSYLFR